MAKNYAKFVPPKSRAYRKKTGRGPYVLAILLGVAGVLAFGSFLYIEKNVANGATTSGSIFSKWVALIHHKKPTPEVAKLVSDKKIATAETPSVHFDFYNELPNMQMPKDEDQTAAMKPPTPTVVAATVAAPAVTPAPVSAPAPATEVAEAEAQAPLSPNEPVFTPAIAETKPVASTVITTKTVTKTVVTKPNPTDQIFNADEVSELLAAEHGSEHYVIQLGAFQSEQAANRLREAIVSVGFEAIVVSSKQSNHKVYHVQQGPYESAALARQSQQRMAKRGIISVIQKSSA